MNEHYTKLSPIDMEIISEAEKKLASGSLTVRKGRNRWEC